MILVTGGAGFIGGNFVLDWLARTRRAGARISTRSPTPATREPGFARGDPRHVLRARRHRRPRRCSSGCSPSTGRARCCISPPKAMSTAASSGRPSSSAPTSRAPSRCSKRRATWWTRARRGAQRVPSASCTSRPTRSTASSAATMPRFTESHAVRAEQPVLGQQGGAATIWCARGTTPTGCRC